MGDVGFWVQVPLDGLYYLIQIQVALSNKKQISINYGLGNKLVLIMRLLIEKQIIIIQKIRLLLCAQI